MEDRKIAVSVGSAILGPGHPILIQSMCNVSTMDTEACAEQCIRIFEAGGGLARITTRNKAEAQNLKNIRQKLNRRGYEQPISADVHFNPLIAIEAAKHVEKVRINPGNFAAEDIEVPFREFLDVCRKHNTAIRIGVNHGSLSERIMDKFGDSPEGMVESALEYLRICKREDFTNVVVSLKSSNTRIMVYSNRLMMQKMAEEDLIYPLHLGVTEAGDGEEGRIRSAVGIGTLLGEGLGDTLRVSLTEDPEFEVPVAEKLVKAAGVSERSEEDRQSPGFQPTSYLRRTSEKYPLIGGGQSPIVIAGYHTDKREEEADNPSGTDPDYYVVPDHLLLEDLPAAGRYIINAESWLLDDYPPDRFFPLFDLPGIQTIDRYSEILNFILVRPEEISEAGIILKQKNIPCGLIYMHDPARKEAFHEMVADPGLSYPIIIRAAYKDSDREMFQIRAAAELGWYFLDGYADGLWLDNTFSQWNIPRQTAFKILQASRARQTETEYIACPSCGRTLFDIQDTLAKVRAGTSRQKHLKIAVMGCIVNGPGEMADADYGYVGSGKGRVSLYKQKDIIKKNIPEQDALSELVNLIKENGDWHD